MGNVLHAKVRLGGGRREERREGDERKVRGRLEGDGRFGPNEDANTRPHRRKKKMERKESM